MIQRREGDLPLADTKELRTLHLWFLRVGARGKDGVLWMLHTGVKVYWDPIPGTKIKRYKDIFTAISNHYMCLILLLNTFKSHSFAA